MADDRTTAQSELFRLHAEVMLMNDAVIHHPALASICPFGKRHSSVAIDGCLKHMCGGDFGIFVARPLRVIHCKWPRGEEVRVSYDP